MPAIELNTVGYDTLSNLPRLVEKYNENFRQLDWLLNQKKLDGANFSENFLQVIAENQDISDLIDKLMGMGMQGPSIQNLTLPDAYINSEYVRQFGCSLTGTVKWSIAEGELPNGLTLNPNTGELSGTTQMPINPATGLPFPENPNMDIQYSTMFTIAASNEEYIVYGTYYIHVRSSNRNVPSTPFLYLTLNEATSGEAYEYNVGFGYLDFQIEEVSIITGQLPTGLKIVFRNLGVVDEGNGSKTASSIITISGIPTQIGFFRFSILIKTYRTENGNVERKEWRQTCEIIVGSSWIKKISMSPNGFTVVYEDDTSKAFEFVRDDVGAISKVKNVTDGKVMDVYY